MTVHAPARMYGSEYVIVFPSPETRKRYSDEVSWLHIIGEMKNTAVGTTTMTAALGMRLAIMRNRRK